jgi:PAS domain-containing protein
LTYNVTNRPTAGVPPAPGPPLHNQDRQVMPRLPIEEYAIAIPTDIARSAIVISGSPGLACRNRVPIQIFPAAGILPGEVAVRSSKDELRRAGLEDLFKPDPDGTVNSFPLPYEGLADTFLLCKLKPNHSLDHVKTICNRQADDIRTLVDQKRSLVSDYEWQILRTVFLSTAPCLAVDEGQRVVSANAMLCELTERTHDQIVGADVDDVIHMEKEVTGDIARYPGCTEFTSPLFMRTLSAFFVSDLQLSLLDTVCGDRLVVVFRDLLTDQRTGNSNIHLIRKISAMVMSEDPPQKVLRRLSNILTSALDCDLVCILRRKQNDEMIVTPYVNRSLHTLRANIVERVKEPQLDPFFRKGSAVFCDAVEQECPQDSFFRRVLKISRFAFLPAGAGPQPEYALLMAWTRTNADFGPRVLPLLRIIANLMASVLVSAKRFFEMEQEKDALRRHVRLTAGREVRMAEIKKENAHLKEMIQKLSEKAQV